jgi:hypothetical protein
LDEHRDIAIAVFGGATGLASVLLVFVGFLLATGQSFPSGTPKKLTNRYTLFARLGLIPIALCVAAMLASYGWLFHPGNMTLATLWQWSFVLASWIFLIYASAALFWLL